ncbi:hypothetical protein Baya_11775 [Bagarius yarrelli]|uniref:Uncharacterized protein n=1 Tax=Bagarius yarrelli TaxID=175774 RepID=A0A556V147_BAGYA|nr:hypothetical protein Baya_11775 [Bagarius yarrelli]
MRGWWLWDQSDARLVALGSVLMREAGGSGGISLMRDSLPAGIMEGLEGTEVPPGGRQAILQKLTTALTRCLEKLDITPEPEGCKCGKPEEGDRTSLEEFRLSTPFPSADLGEPAAGDTLFFRANKR